MSKSKLIIAITTLSLTTSFTSCKKDYACECKGVKTTIYGEHTYNGSIKQPKTENIFRSQQYRVKKKETAIAKCSVYGSSITSSGSGTYAGYPHNWTILVDCEIK